MSGAGSVAGPWRGSATPPVGSLPANPHKQQASPAARHHADYSLGEADKPGDFAAPQVTNTSGEFRFPKQTRAAQSSDDEGSTIYIDAEGRFRPKHDTGQDQPD